MKDDKELTEVFGHQVVDKMYSKGSELVNAYRARHSKVFMTRFDLQYHQDTQRGQDNKDIQRCMASVAKNLKRKHLDPAYIWAREQRESHNPHYHLLVLVNGNKTQYAKTIYDVVNSNWLSATNQTGGGLVHRCKEENGKLWGEMLRRGEEPTEWSMGKLTYLCKPQAKGERNDGLRDFGMSRIPKSR